MVYVLKIVYSVMCQTRNWLRPAGDWISVRDGSNAIPIVEIGVLTCWGCDDNPNVPVPLVAKEEPSVVPVLPSWPRPVPVVAVVAGLLVAQDDVVAAFMGQRVIKIYPLDRVLGNI
jgi:hypothetical protein